MILDRSFLLFAIILMRQRNLFGFVETPACFEVDGASVSVGAEPEFVADRFPDLGGSSGVHCRGRRHGGGTRLVAAYL